MIRRLGPAFAGGLAVVLCLSLPAAASLRTRLDALMARRDAGMAVVQRGRILYAHGAGRRRPPASNQKLILSMALFDVFGPGYRIPTRALAARTRAGVVPGNLWIVGGGDPTFTSAVPTQSDASGVGDIAAALVESGITRVRGDIVGSTVGFARDWDAPGWQPYVQALFAPLPTALAMNSNTAGGVHVADPERRFAAALRDHLLARGIVVEGGARAGGPHRRLKEIARIESARLSHIVAYMNRWSSNFYAENLTKALGRRVFGSPGTIAKGARALKRWAGLHGVEVAAYDGSGLSYTDRVSPTGMARLLDTVRDEPWFAALRRALPAPGSGTMSARLSGLAVRAKTGTHLNGDSALSGYLSLRRGGRVAFSILSKDMPKSVEDMLIRILATARFRPSPPLPCLCLAERAP